MFYSKFILLFLSIVSIIFIVHVKGQDAPVKEEELKEFMEYEVDEHGNIISSKKVLRKENEDLPNSTFKPDFIDDDIPPVEMNEDESAENENENIIDELENDEDTEDLDEFEQNFITVHMGNFIHHPNENEIDNQNNEEIVITEIPTIYENEDDNEDEGEEVNEIELQTIYENDNNNEDEGEGEGENENEDENKNDDGSNVMEVEIVLDETIIMAKSSEMKDFFKTNEKMVIGCFEDTGNEEYLNFRNVSNSMIESPNLATENYFNGEALKFVYINDNQCRSIVKRYTGISIFKNDVVYCINKRCYEYNPKDLIDFNKFKKFIESKNLPLVSVYDPDEKDIYSQWKIPMVIYLNNDEEKTKKDIKEFIEGIAEEYRKEFFFFVTNEKQFDINMLNEPVNDNVLIYAPHFQTLYSIQEILEPGDIINREALESFIVQYKKDLLRPKIVTQEFEKLWDYDGFLVKSVPKFYYPTVLNPLRDSLVIFYKEDCPYSRKLLRTFRKLGRKYANYRSEFSVVKYEAEDQKIPKMSLWRKLEGYPTVVLFKASPYTRQKKEFFVYPDNAGRSAVSIDKWVQIHSFYKPKITFTLEDYKEKERLEIDAEEIEDNEEEEERITKYLEDPNLIFTRFGYGKEMEGGDDDDDEDSGEDEAEYYFDNVNINEDIPMTGTYYELTSTTYAIRTSTYTPTPSFYDDDEEEKEKEKNDDE